MQPGLIGWGLCARLASGLEGRNMQVLPLVVFTSLSAFVSGAVRATGLDPNAPTWWGKYQYIQNGGNILPNSTSSSLSIGGNVDVSNECGPQSEMFIAMQDGRAIAGGSSETCEVAWLQALATWSPWSAHAPNHRSPGRAEVRSLSYPPNPAIRCLLSHSRVRFEQWI